MNQSEQLKSCQRCSRLKAPKFFKRGAKTESGYDRICKLCRYDQTFKRQLELEIREYNMPQYKHVIPDPLLPVWEVESRKKI